MKAIFSNAFFCWSFYLRLLAILCGILPSLALAQQSVTLAWDAATDSTVAGYRLYYGTASGTYPNVIDEGTTTTATVSNLQSGPTYYFVVTAYSSAGLESSPSSEVVFSVGPPVSVAASAANLAANTASVVITGAGFDAVAANNTVLFNNGVAGSVTAASATSLTVAFTTPPSTVGNLTAVVTTNGSASGAPVQVATVIPVVSASAANLTANAGSVVINGFGFDPVAANNSVLFNDGAVGSVTAASATSLTVAFSTKPTSAGNLTSVVTTAGVSSGAAVQVATVTPVVTASAAQILNTSATVTINGFGFASANTNNTVVFNLGAVGAITSSSPTQLVATFSTKPSAGNLTAVVTSNALGSGAAVQVATVPVLSITSSAANLAKNIPQITIAGVGFSTTPANNSVTFNNNAAGSVTAATTTQLTVSFSTQPAVLGALNATVSVAGVGAAGPVQVATIVAPTAVTSSTASLAINSPSVTIAGSGFSTTAANNSVVFNDGAAGSVTAASATSLTVAFTTPPSAVGSLTAVVTSNGSASGAAVQVATVIPVVSASTANLAANAAGIVITGLGFDPVVSHNAVLFNDGAIGSVTAASATSLTIAFSTKPVSAGNLTAVVTTAIVTTGSVSSGPAVQVATVTPVVTASTAQILNTSATVTINGFGFASANANNTVAFNLGAAGTITSSSPTQLVATFSTKPTAGNLTAVITSNALSSGAAAQVATVPVLSITSSAANLAQNFPQLTIAGAGFSTTPANNSVTFNNNAVGSVTAATTTQLTVSFSTQPAALGALNATLSVAGVGAAGPVQVATIIAPTAVTSSTASLAINSPSVVITGSGFSTTAANNSVVFNDGAAGSVTAATATSLTVAFTTPPSAVGSLTAVVTSNGSASGAPVQVATVIPVVSASAANLTANAASVIINGLGFDPVAANNTVLFNDGAAGSVTAASATSLTIAFSTKPTSAGNLTAVVTTDGASNGVTVQIATVTPVITASTTQILNTSATVTINGFGFASANANNTVVFNLGAVGAITSSSPTQLVATFSTKPGAGNLTAVITSNALSSGAVVQVATVPVLSITSSAASLAQNVSQITIAGAGFSTTPANNSVTFNNNAAGSVTAATSTQLTVSFSTQPAALGALNATVTVAGVGAAGPVQVATVIAPTAVTSSTASLPINSPSVTLAGSGFSTTAANNSVVFNDGAAGSVTAATATSLTVTFTTPPSAVGSLTAVVTSNSSASGAAVQVATVIPVVSASIANLAANAAGIVITGLGFDPIAANNTVVFNDGAVGSVTTASATSLTIAFSSKPASAGSLTAVVTTNGLSNGAAVQVATVQTLLTITTNPSSLTVGPGRTATFTAAASGNPAPTVQWQFSADGGSTFTDLAGATSSPLSITAAASDNGRQYRAAFSNGVSTPATTTAATLKVNTPATAVNQTAYITDKSPVQIDVLAGASNPDNDTLTIVSVTQGANGSVSIANGAAMIIYTPKSKVVADSFQYTLSDGYGGVSTAAVSVQVLRHAAGGTYNGLVQAAPAATSVNENSGLLRISISSTTGKFTGSLKLAADRFPLSGTFDSQGAGRFGAAASPTVVLKRKNLPALQLTLQIDLDTTINRISGALTENGAPFATLSANRALYTASKKPVAPLINVPAGLLGNYTVVFAAKEAPNNGLAAAEYPQGHGIGLLTVSAYGNARLVGTLADGSPFAYANALSAPNALSGTNEWPVYVALEGGLGSLSGAADFAQNTTLQFNLEGLGLHWFKPAKPQARIYPAGWVAGIETDLLGSKFVKPSPKANPSLPGFGAAVVGAAGNADIFLADGNVPAPGINQAVNINTNNTVSVISPNPANVKLKAIETTGIFTGSFSNPSASAPTSFKGVIFQGQKTGYGFFLGGGQSGSVTLSQQ